MLESRVGVLLIRLSLPAMAGMVVYAFFNLLDTYFVARLGSAALAAITLCLPPQVLIISIASATGVGLTSLIGRVLGAGNTRHADNVTWHGIGVIILYSAVFIWLGYRWLDEMLIWFGCTPDIFALSRGYLSIVLPGALFVMIQIILGNILQGEGNTFAPVVISLLGMILNVVFDPLFIFGYGPIPGMGLNGAAWASVLAQFISTAAMVAFMLGKRRYLRLDVANLKPRLDILGAVYKVGLPAMAMEVAGVFIMVYINRILGHYSYEAIAALGIFLRIRSLVFMPLGGLLQGTMPIASFAFGAGRMDRVKEILVKASVLAALGMSAGWLVMQVYPEWILQFFSRDPLLTAAGVSCLRLGTLVMPVVGPIIILSTVLQSIGQGMSAMWLSLARQVGLFLPALVILPAWLGADGVWLAFTLSEALAGLLFLFFWQRLWRDLQEGRASHLLVLIRRGALWHRIRAWMRWDMSYFL